MKHYCLHCGKELEEEQLLCPKCEHCSFLDAFADSKEALSGALAAQQIEANTQWMKYKCGRNSNAGHGFAAEDYNSLNDRLQGKQVESVGRDNSKYGADRTVDGVPIQTKYYASARASVEAAFKDGQYAYDGQLLEVPSDQYEEALSIMGEKIKEHPVNGYSNPQDADKIVKCGSVTYQQARNIAKAGNIDSLLFDAKTQSVTALSTFGISFAINYGMMLFSKEENHLSAIEAVQLAFLKGLQSGTISLSSGILTAQLLKTEAGRNLASYINAGAKAAMNGAYKTAVGKDVIENLASAIFNKSLYGGAARNASIRFIRVNVITNLALFAITSIPDTFNMLQGSISKPQFVENLVINSSSIIGGTLGTVVGAMLGPYGMIGGGLAGGAVFSWASKKVARFIRKEDSEQMCELVKVALVRLSHDYMIQSEEEFQRCIQAITADQVIDTALLRVMYSIGAEDNNDWLRVQIAYERLAYYFGAIIRQRKTIHLRNKDKAVVQAISRLGEDLPALPQECQ